MTGGKVNQGGYGLEVPCVYVQATLWTKGVLSYIEKMRELVNSLRTAALL